MTTPVTTSETVASVVRMSASARAGAASPTASTTTSAVATSRRSRPWGVMPAVYRRAPVGREFPRRSEPEEAFRVARADHLLLGLGDRESRDAVGAALHVADIVRVVAAVEQALRPREGIGQMKRLHVVGHGVVVEPLEVLRRQLLRELAGGGGEAGT